VSARDERIVLEEIAYSSDPAVSAGDRLRALERLDGLENLERCAERELRRTSSVDDLDAWDELQADAVRAILAGNPDFITNLPKTAAAVLGGVREKARQLVEPRALSGARPLFGDEGR